MSARFRAGRRFTPTVAGLVALTGLVAGCAGTAPAPGTGSQGVVADSITVALYPFDETGSTRVSDSGPFRLEAVAGVETRTDFGRNRNARRFSRSFDSFVYAPWNPVFDTASLTIEMWVWLDDFSQHENSTLVSRWGADLDRSWLLAVVGRDLPIVVTGPRYHAELMHQRTRGLLMFAYQPDDAGPVHVFFSSRPLELQRWTRVAVTVDGQIVRLFLDGLLDANYVSLGGIRASKSPLLIGNWFDTRRLTDFGGDLRVSATTDAVSYYSVMGMLDELRISSTARTPESLTGGR